MRTVHLMLLVMIETDLEVTQRLRQKTWKTAEISGSFVCPLRAADFPASPDWYIICDDPKPFVE